MCACKHYAHSKEGLLRFVGLRCRQKKNHFLLLSDDTKLDAKNLEYLKYVPDEDWRSYLDFGIEFVNKQKRLEENLVKAHIFVQNGSISHMQLLDALPNEEARKDNDIARKLLAASLYILNSKCLSHGIEGEECEKFLAMKTLPANCELINDCFKIIESRRNGHNSFRRLLPRFYQDGIYEVLNSFKHFYIEGVHNKME
ncbi:PREDICTED: uncharacterized protein LOC108359294 isoform X2 [Rhagoletis zephyria]|uniref:uncharacterized protein LOC108359294 isoform X2 n=1 Tax=Rhagoletis zephyria TaxID=28612 RepID=UPI0008116018|nr:PREDICTED: uncharacterized protein LOC108359294 isoform X2 [Rhagoletis zephyria]